MPVQLIPAEKFDKAEQMKQVAADGQTREFLIEEGDSLTAITFAAQVRMTVGELRELCETSDAPLAVQKARSLKGLPERMVVTILRQDRDEIAAKVSKPAVQQAESRESRVKSDDKVENSPAAEQPKAAEKRQAEKPKAKK